MSTFVAALRSALRLSCAAALLAVSAVALSQTQPAHRSIRAVPQPAAPAPSAAAAPAGLPSPIPNPAGLTSRFPAGLPPLAGAGRATPAATDAGPNPDSSVPPQTNVLGAPGYGGVMAGAPAPAQAATARTGPYTALQAAQSFLAADGNRDGELTRAEAGRLTIAPYAFEEMDRNHDGILTRFEYEDALR